MRQNASRRSFLQAGLALPAAGLVASSQLGAAAAPLRTLGKTGLKVAPVGYGVGFAPDPSVVARALDLGVNYYDVARSYSAGNSERILGMALKGHRDKVVLISKSGAKNKADALSELDTSLQTLGTDHLDVWFLHARDTPAAIGDDLVEACETAKKQGKTRFIGVSTHDPNAVVDRIVGVGKFDVVLLTYSYPMGTTRDAAIAKMHNAGIGLVAMKVIVATAGFDAKAPVKPMLPGDGPLAALKWAIKNPAIAVAIPFMKDVEQLEMNVRAFTEPYTPADEKMLVARSEEIRPFYCRMCYQCKGQCPQGVPVTDELRFLAYNDFCGDFHKAQVSFMELPRAIRKVSCSDCTSCAIQCPNGVQVRDRLIRAQELLA